MTFQDDQNPRIIIEMASLHQYDSIFFKLRLLRSLLPLNHAVCHLSPVKLSLSGVFKGANGFNSLFRYKTFLPPNFHGLALFGVSLLHTEISQKWYFVSDTSTPRKLMGVSSNQIITGSYYAV
jgi:hypothetical protein